MKKGIKRIPTGFWILTAGIVFLLLISLCSSWIAPYDYQATDTKNLLSPPNLQHWMGTDEQGRDVFSRVLVGSKNSIFSAFILIALAGSIGSLIGLLGGYYGGFADSLLMRVTDIFLSFPDMILAVAVAGVLGGGLTNAMIAILLTSWTQYARLARSSTRAIKEENYIQAAKLSGCSEIRILFVHILPNIISPLIVTATLHISGVMMGIAGLSFLGLGVKVPDAEWGSMISVGRNYLQTAPWMAIGPSLVMVLVMMAFNLFGDYVRDLMDPKQRKS